MSDPIQLPAEAHAYLVENARELRRLRNTIDQRLSSMQKMFGIDDEELIIPRMTRRNKNADAPVVLDFFPQSQPTPVVAPEPVAVAAPEPEPVVDEEPEVVMEEPEMAMAEAAPVHHKSHKDHRAARRVFMKAVPRGRKAFSRR